MTDWLPTLPELIGGCLAVALWVYLTRKVRRAVLECAQAKADVGSTEADEGT